MDEWDNTWHYYNHCFNKVILINTIICIDIAAMTQWAWKKRVLNEDVVVVQSLSCVWLVATPWTVACQAPLCSTTSQSLFRFMSVESVMLSNHFIFCWPLFLLSSIIHSITVFSNESVLCFRWTKYGSFSISPPYEYSGLISFRTDWFDDSQ